MTHAARSTRLRLAAWRMRTDRRGIARRVVALTVLALAASQAGAAPPIPDAQVTPEMLVSRLTRGIRAAPASAAPAPSVDLNIRFRTGSAELDPDSLPVVTALGRALADPALRADRFPIEGHTDTVGNPAANLDLSDRRARRVAAYLVEHFDVPPQRLLTRGMGEEGLAVPTPDQTDEPRNRRVHVVNLGG